MIRFFASNKIKQPIMLEIPEVEWQRLSKIQDKNELNHKLLKLAQEQIVQHGYEMGRCSYREKQVTFRDCTSCALSRGMKTKTEWENCVKEHVRYNFEAQKLFKNKINDEKIKQKLDFTKTEAAKHNNEFKDSPELNKRDYFDQQEMDLINKTRKDKQGEWDEHNK